MEAASDEYETLTFNGNKNTFSCKVMIITVKSLDKPFSKATYDIYIDGKEAGSVAYRGTTVLKVPPGAHSLQAKVNFYGSRKLKIEAREYNSMTLTVKFNLALSLIMPLAILIMMTLVQLIGGIFKFIGGIFMWLAVPAMIVLLAYFIFIMPKKSIELTTE